MRKYLDKVHGRDIFEIKLSQARLFTCEKIGNIYMFIRVRIHGCKQSLENMNLWIWCSLWNCASTYKNRVGSCAMLLLLLLLLMSLSMKFFFHPKWLFIEPMACAYYREWWDAHNFPSSCEESFGNTIIDTDTRTHTYIHGEMQTHRCCQDTQIHTCSLIHSLTRSRSQARAWAHSIININVHIAKNQLWCIFSLSLVLFTEWRLSGTDR